MKVGSYCAYMYKCFIYCSNGCDGRDYEDCSYKEELKKEAQNGTGDNTSKNEFNKTSGKSVNADSRKADVTMGD